VIRVDARHAARLGVELRRRFRVVETPVTLGDRVLTILHPASAEELINEADFERDERLPYWAELWPSALVLAELVLAMPGAGSTFLELGCGAGLVATAATLAGYRVRATDYYDDALRFTAVNVAQNAGTNASGFTAEHLDWRAAPPSTSRFDVVAAADVLYERPYGALVARVFGAMLAPGGAGFLADPGRVARDDFLAALADHGLEVVAERPIPFVHDRVRQTITVFGIAHSG
jgi:predicted nicotinamide N-methyase